MSSLDENLKWAHPRGPGSRPRTSDNRKHIETTVLDLEKIDFQGFLGMDVSRRGSQRNVQRTFFGKKSICESSLISISNLFSVAVGRVRPNIKLIDTCSSRLIASRQLLNTIS